MQRASGNGGLLLFYVIGNFVPYDIKTLREDATGAQVKMQADASTGTAALSNNYKFIDKHVISWYIYQRMYFFPDYKENSVRREKCIN